MEEATLKTALHCIFMAVTQSGLATEPHTNGLYHVGESTPYPKGVSVKYVPDMDGGTEPQGTLTFFYSNQQSARLMFYHDHALGITRLNVYAGVAAGYLLTDSTETSLISNAGFFQI